MENTIVFTDIHGSYNEFIFLLNKVNYEKNKQKLIFLGDYVDRGPKSKDLIDFLIDLKKENSETVFLLGNHDDWFMSFLKGDMETDMMNLWLNQGGYQTLLSYKPDYAEENMSLEDIRKFIHKVYPSHVDFLSNLELYHEDENFYYAHGGCRLFESDITKSEKEEFIWPNRSMFFNTETELDKPIVIGHTVVKNLHGINEPFITKDKIGIDGGIVFGLSLICMIVENKNGNYLFEILNRKL